MGGGCVHASGLCVRIQTLVEGSGMEIIRDRCQGQQRSWLQNLPNVPPAASARSTHHPAPLCAPLCACVSVRVRVLHNQLITSLCSSGPLTGGGL